MRKTLTSLAISGLVISLAACGQGSTKANNSTSPSAGGTGAGSSAPAKDVTVGIAMPTKTSSRWIADGNNVVKQLGALGYKADLQYANDNIANQVSQVENMITKKDKVLIIAAIDGTALSNVLQSAADAKIPVISYDRLIRKSTNVDYYCSFDNFKVGVLQANALVSKLDMKKAPLNIELFAGSPDDNNATFFFNGAMSVLKPLIDSKKLVVKSGQTGFTQVATLRWLPEKAQARMDDLLNKSYTSGARVDGVLSPYDGLSIGILSSLKSAGYGTAGKPLPIVTGQDAEVPSVKSIIAGEQSSTIYKDTRKLAKVAVDMTVAVLSGKKPEVNNTKDYDNGVKVVPSFLLDPVAVDKTNYQKILVDGGYYTAAQLK